MIIPERMVPILEETTRGRVSKLPLLQKEIILKYCRQSPETFNITFPFICGDEDLAANSQGGFYLHVIDLPVHVI